MRAVSAWLRDLGGWRADVAAAVLGALAAAALPPFTLVPILLLCVPGLLVLLDTAPTARTAFRRAFWFGFANYAFGLYWITDAILVEAAQFWWLVPIAVPALAAILALFIAVPCTLAWHIPAGGRRVLVLAGGWTLADLARQFAVTGFPWNPWGSVWELPGVAGDVMIQPAAWIGVHGLTLATLLLAATPSLGRRGWVAGGAGLALWIGLGTARLSLPPPAAPGVSVVLVQGNIGEGQRWNADLARRIFEHHLDLTQQGVMALPAGARAVVIWPETASPYLVETDANARAAIMQATGGRPALVGSVRFDTRQQPRNSLMALIGAEPPVTIYDKWHLVPFGEYVPAWLPIPIAFGLPISFAPGPGPQTLHVLGLPPAGALICYEAIFPARIVDAADRPAWLVNVTNDAWFGDSTGPRQHLAAARMRAVEEGLPVMRAANTGVSAAFDARGRELVRIGLGISGVIDIDLPGAETPTWFAQSGLTIPLVLALVAVLAGVWVPGRGFFVDKRGNV